MCGIPHHAARGYVARLTEQGHKVVICEQVEDPKAAKGLVRREVVQIVTPGVVVDDEVLDPKTARYVAAIGLSADQRLALAYLDVSTGEFRGTSVASEVDLVAELSRVAPREILVSAGKLDKGPIARICARYREAAVTTIEPLEEAEARGLLSTALAGSLEDLGLEAEPALARAAADVLHYARQTQPTGVLPIARLQVYQSGESVVLDEAAVANLELTRTLQEGKKAGSLLSVIDMSKTAPGGRELRRWLLYPLMDPRAIEERLDAVEYLVERANLREQVREALAGVYDLERLTGRLSLGVATPRDLWRLKTSLQALPQVARLLGKEAPELLRADKKTLTRLAKVAAQLQATLMDEPPVQTKDGGIIRDGVCKEVDENRALAHGGKEAIAAIEERERKATGISNLRVKYNRVFGYYIEVSKSNIDRVPDTYVRKQTIATAERYVTPELADLESKIVSAQELLVAREQELFGELVESCRQHKDGLDEASSFVARVDVVAALAEIAQLHGYTRPVIAEDETIAIREGRHPVVEQHVEHGTFVPNDCTLSTEDSQLLLITGPNMAGKSTYMRQVAHIVLMAQMGSFVPAGSAHIGLVDRIFTRVGAGDNLARGESTFMVEMRETATILSGATRRSLVVLDEVGRGTSTFDGVSIAWAVSEYLHDAIGARTLFATHYHELTALAESRPRVQNVSVAVREHKGRIVFLRQVTEGGANKSYGIDVARLAGLPRSVISRARQLLKGLERGQLHGETSQLSLFSAVSASPEETDAPANPEPRLVRRLRDIDPHQLTPIEALSVLAELVESAQGQGDAAP
jgi:DNA mismatch repair protein MutS